jgi:hypothetical protein
MTVDLSKQRASGIGFQVRGIPCACIAPFHFSVQSLYLFCGSLSLAVRPTDRLFVGS